MVDTNFRGGGDLHGGQGFETEGHWVCSRLCLESPKCTHWTYVSKWTVNCYLKAGKVLKEEVNGYISGTYGRECGQFRQIKRSKH